MDAGQRISSPGRNRRITKTLLARIIVASFLSMGVLIGCFTYWEYLDFRSQTETMRREHVESQMALVRSEVEKAFDYILYEKSRTEERLKERLINRVYEAHAVATNIYREHSGTNTDDDIRKMIKDALRPVRFNNGRGYYFATNLDGKEELFADRPDEEGKDYLNVRDARGKYLVREMIEVVKSAGEGFVEYAWTKPGVEGNDFPKVAFVKLFEPLNYFVGTGEYIDDTTADIQAEVLKRISRVRYADSGYIFVVSYDGFVLSGHPKQKNVGKNLWDMADPDGVKVIQEERRAVENPDGGFIRYRWPKPGHAEPSPKISFLKGIPDWEWMVGTGVYVDEMEPVIAAMARLLRKQILQRAFLVAAVFFGLAFIMFSLARRSALLVTEGFKAFSSFFEKAAADSVRVDEDKLFFSEFRKLAGPANRMVDERQRIEEKLSAELEKRSRIQASLEESEEKYQKLFNNEIDAISIFDVETKKLLDVNGAWLKLYGYSRDEALQLAVYDVSAEPEQTKEAINKSAVSGDTLIPLRHHRKKDGTEFWVELSAGPFTWKGRKVMFAVVRDITARKQTEEFLKSAKDSLEKQNEELRKIDQVKDGLLRDVSHELKTPVAKYAMQLDILKPIIKKYRLSSEERQAFTVMEESLRRQEGVIKNLLDLSRLEDGGRKFRRDPFRLDELIGKVKEDYQHLLDQHGAEISITVPPITIRSDGEMLWHLFSNLLSNAIKFREKEEPLRISVSAEAADGNVTVHVADEGAGFSEKEREQAFERFYQSTASNEGSGVGLTICRMIVSGLGGRISIRSEGKGRGAVVSVTLPAG